MRKNGSMKKNGTKLGRPKLPDQERAVRDSALFLLPREWEKLRTAGGIGVGESTAPLLQRIVRDWISRNT